MLKMTVVVEIVACAYRSIETVDYLANESASCRVYLASCIAGCLPEWISEPIPLEIWGTAVWDGGVGGKRAPGWLTEYSGCAGRGLNPDKSQSCL